MNAAEQFAQQMRAEVRVRKIGEATADGVTRALQAAARKVCGCGRC